jgi:hypothetical protein
VIIVWVSIVTLGPVHRAFLFDDGLDVYFSCFVKSILMSTPSKCLTLLEFHLNITICQINRTDLHLLLLLLVQRIPYRRIIKDHNEILALCVEVVERSPVVQLLLVKYRGLHASFVHQVEKVQIQYYNFPQKDQ